jgi:hypothetical protein
MTEHLCSPMRWCNEPQGRPLLLVSPVSWVLLVFFIKSNSWGFKLFSLLSLGRPFGAEPKSLPRLGGQGFKFFSLLSLGRPFGAEPKSLPRLGGREFKILSLLSLGRPFGTEPKSLPKLGSRGLQFFITHFCLFKRTTQRREA